MTKKRISYINIVKVTDIQCKTFVKLLRNTEIVYVKQFISKVVKYMSSIIHQLRDKPKHWQFANS